MFQRPSILIVLSLLFCGASGCRQQTISQAEPMSDRTKGIGASKEPTIRLLTDPRSTEQGILVTCPKRICQTGEHAGRIKIEFANYLDDEIFLEVTGFEVVAFSADGGGIYGTDSLFRWPGNERLMKLLHRGPIVNGKRRVCGCCAVTIYTRLSPKAMELGNVKGTIHIPICGFYRSTGKYFNEWIELPIEIVADDP